MIVAVKWNTIILGRSTISENMANKQALVSVLMSLISWRTLLISLRSPRAQSRGFRLRIRETAGACFALKSMLSRRRHRFQIVFAFTCGHQKRFTNGNVWTRINLKTDKYLSVFKFIRIRVDGALEMDERN